MRRKAIQDNLLLADILNYARSLKITHKAVKTLEEDLNHLASPSSNVNAVCYHQENQESQCTSGNQNQFCPKNTEQEKSGELQRVRKYVITVVTIIMQDI